MNMDNKYKWGLLLVVMLGWALDGHAQTAQQDTAAKSAQATVNSIPEATYDHTENTGEDGEGTFIINGESIDAKKIAPGVNKTKAARTSTLNDSAENLNDLKGAYETERADTSEDGSYSGDAERIVDRSTRPIMEKKRELEADQAFFQPYINASKDARQGKVGGQDFGQCTTTQTKSSTPSNVYTLDEAVCEITNTPGNPGGEVCTRKLERSTVLGTITQEKSGTLAVNNEVNAKICSREVTASGVPILIDQSFSQALEYATESSGDVCSTTRTASTVVSWVAKSKTSVVTINKETNGYLCKRDRWAETQVTGTSGTQNATLDIIERKNSRVCSRTRWPTSSTVNTAMQKAGVLLTVNQEPNNVSYGEKWHWPTSNASVTAQGLNSTLAVNKESTLAICTRTITPSDTTTNVAGTYNGKLTIDTQVDGINICKRTITPASGTSTQAVSVSKDLSVNKELGGVEGTRTRWPTADVVTQPGTQTGALNVNTEANNALQGSKWHWPASAPQVTSQAMNSVLTTNKESNANFCSRTIKPTATTVNQPSTKSVSLDIDTQVDGVNICKRTVTPASGSTVQVVTVPAVLNINKEKSEALGTRTRWPSATTNTVSSTDSGVLNVNEEVDGTILGSRWHWPTANSGTVPQNYSANLNINNDMSGVVATKSIWASSNAVSTPGTHSGSLNIDTQVPGNICKRTVWPTNAVGSVAGSQSALLDVNTESTGNVATTAHWPTTTGGSTPGSQNASLTNFPTGKSGLIRQKNRWVVNGLVASARSDTLTLTPANQWNNNQPASFNVPINLASKAGSNATLSGMTGVLTVQRVSDNSTFCGNSSVAGTITVMPSAANGWIGNFQVNGFYYSPVGGCAGPFKASIVLNWNWDDTFGKVFTVQNIVSMPAPQSGPNCSLDAPVCNTSAPTTINSIAVSVADVSGLPKLYPSLANSCTSASELQTCSGTQTLNNTVNITASLPGGTTAISGFNFVVNNPQVGITVGLIQAPSLANSWNAIFSVTKNAWTDASVAPDITMNWTIGTSTTSWVVNNTGNPNDAGSPFCPASWSCNLNAPATVNGVSVTTPMAQAQPLLYSGAANTCLAASKDKVCGGSATTSTSVSIAGQVAPGATAISGFTFNVANPQAGVTIALSQTPSLANSWVAIFDVTRTNWSGVPVKPDISMSWTASVPTINTSVQDSGSCAGSGSANCPATWSCESNAPFTVNGISVTGALAATQAPLYPSAASSCVVASQDKVCSGTANVQSTISIATKIAGGVNAISGFNFVVTNPQSGVVVSLVSAPSLANGWVATFNVARSNWAGGLVQPNLDLNWSMDVPGVALTVNSTGVESDPGTATCPASWACTATAPQTINGISVSAGMAATLAPLYPGASNTACTNASKSKVCSGGAVLTNIDISGQLAPGTISISGFSVNITNPQPGVTATVVTVPSAGNGWVAVIQTSRSNWTYVPVAPTVSLNWTATTSTTTFTQQTSGTTSGGGSSSCPTSWSCVDSAPGTVNSIAVTVPMVQALPLLYAGATNTCLKADFKIGCSGNADVSTTLNIASKIQVGVTSISNFTFAVSNPESGITVSLVTAPTLANGWNATFNVRRSVWATVPAKPNITMSWDQAVPTVTFAIQDLGTVSASNSANCSVGWNCQTNAPATLNSINITAAMVAGEPLLYPGAASSCLVGEYRRSCTGSHTTQTSVDISANIPVGTTGISNFGFTVGNPQAGVTISVSQTPTAGNGWIAIFNVVRTTWTLSPTDPSISITFDATVGTLGASVIDAGSCAGAGSAQCPAVWTCPTVAPALVAGLTVDVAMATSNGPLYSGAPAACVIASRDTKCTGTADVTTTVDISGDLPANTQSISGFGFTVSNPQPGVTVSLVTAPSAATSWVATFKVSRTNWSSGLVKPAIVVNWDNAVGTVTTAVEESGVCSGSGTASCPASWSCTENAPFTVNGISVTPSMANSHYPLYPGAPTACVVGEYKRVCSGSGGNDSSVSIAGVLPANTTSISNFAWLVVNPQVGVQVAMLSAPTAGNGWTASFRVTRTNWNLVPADAEISMSWDADHTVTSYTQETSGDVLDSGTTSCPAQWSCTQSAPDTVNGVMVLAAVANGLPKLYPTASGTCLRAELKRVCSGNSDTTTVLNIASNIAGGVTTISNFSFVVNNPQTGVTISLVTAPTLANGWNATFNVRRSSWLAVPSQPSITMNWEQGVPTIAFTVQDVGDFSGVSTANCPINWSCKTPAPSIINGINITAAMVAGEPVLYPGASASCLVGEFKRVCTGNHTTPITINITGDLPANTVSINSFSFVVTNPQSGVVVQLAQTPSVVNGWDAKFNVIRSGWTTTPVDPNITINFFADVGTVSTTVEDSSDCSVNGSAQCPAVWTCPTVAPTTVNGLTVDTVMANSKAPLYTGAPNNCVIASRDTKCTGTANTSTTIDLSSQIPANTSSITGFTFVINNAQPGVVVSLLTSPTLANGWKATFRTSRTNWAAGLAEPDITLNWTNVVSSVTTDVVDSPACTDNPSPTCPTSWTCTGNAPKTINGIPVTPALAANHAPLFPGAASTCVEADFKRVCSGTGAMDTSISIAGTLPANTSSIRNFAWVVVNNQVGVGVTLISAPTLANSWTASFRVTRTNWNVVPVDPEISMTWDADHTVTDYVQQTSGDVSSTGTSQCPAVWTCTQNAPGVVNGVGVTVAAAQGLPLLFPGAPNTCLRAELKGNCTGTVSELTSVSIAAEVGSATAITAFTYTTTNIQSGVSIQLLTTPSLANGWVAEFRVNRNNWTTVPAQPNLTLKWNQPVTTVTYAIQDAGTCTESSDAVCSTAWSCRTNAPSTLNGVNVTPAMVAGEPELYSGAPSSCLVGDLDLVCSGNHTTTTEVSIAANIPGGTTVIENFAFTVSNPQSGLTVSLIDAPTLANGWKATFGVEQSTWDLLKNKPDIVMTWNRPESNVVFSVNDTDDCSASGSASCPATWQCNTTAPTTINGLSITAAMLIGESPLYSGGSPSCTSATLSKTCPGSIVTDVAIDVSSEIAVGVNLVRNVAIEVLNPQAGVTASLIDLPTLGNNWVATVRLTRSDLNSVPQDPEIRVTFEAQENTVDVGTDTTCAAGQGGMTKFQPGTQMALPMFLTAIPGGGGGSCVESWVCTANAPTVINGITVTPDMLAGLPELYPGAANTCAAAKVVRTCSGDLIEITLVSIAAVVPPTATALINYQWSVTNPQPGMTVSELEAPSLANGWVGRYAVTRDYALAVTAVAPNLSLTWRVEDGVNTVLSSSETGTCDETSTASCSAQWVCDQSAPGTVNGFNVTGTMLTDQGVSLYSGASSCLKASLNRVCSGNGGLETVIDISDVVPNGVTSIQNFAFEVTTPVGDVNVVLVTAPSYGNGWKASFRTERQDWTLVPPGSPAVKLTWSVDGQPVAGLVPVETGDCSITGDEYCGTKWECTGFADSGGTGTGVTGTKNLSLRPGRNGVVESYDVSIADLIPAGTTSVSNVMFSANVGNGNTVASLITLPSLANNWVATFDVLGRCFDGGEIVLNNNPAIGRMLGGVGQGTFCEPVAGVLSWSANVNGSGQTGGTTVGNGITTADMAGVAPLYPGAPAMCIAAKKVYDCTGMNAGTVCSEGETGEVCDVVAGGPVNTCGELEANPNCSLVKSACNEDMIGTNGFCYLTEKLYQCKQPVTGASDVTVTTTTTCPTALPICTAAGCGTYTETEEPKTQTSVNKTAATMAVLGAIMTDYDGSPGNGWNGSQVEQSPVDTRMASADAGVESGLTGGLAMGDPLPLPGSDTSGWDPWVGPENDDSPIGNPPPGMDTGSLSFFTGKSTNCKKALGGLLNCCTKNTPQSGNVEWWKQYQASMTKGFSGVASCAAPDTQGGWASLGTTSSTGNLGLNAGFTSVKEMLQGGGNPLTCVNKADQKMSTVNDSFMNYANTTQKTKLAWYCSNREYELAVQKKLGSCSYLGSYCNRSVLGVCLDKRQRYCCFNSPMSRMLREQLNTQGIVGMGTAKNPKCGGINFDQLKNLNMGSMDTSELEGLMFEAGAIPSINSVDFSQLLEQLTGTGSLVGNDGRIALDVRTQDRMGQVNAGETKTVAEDQILSQVPTSVPNAAASAGNVTFANSQVYVQRGDSVFLSLTRNGGVGAASVSVTAVSDTATVGNDFDLLTSTVEWNDGDTSTKTIKINTYNIMPVVTTNKQFMVQISVTAGSITINPSRTANVVIQPRK